MSLKVVSVYIQLPLLLHPGYLFCIDLLPQPFQWFGHDRKAAAVQNKDVPSPTGIAFLGFRSSSTEADGYEAHHLSVSVHSAWCRIDCSNIDLYYSCQYYTLKTSSLRRNLRSVERYYWFKLNNLAVIFIITVLTDFFYKNLYIYK